MDNGDKKSMHTSTTIAHALLGLVNCYKIYISSIHSVSVPLSYLVLDGWMPKVIRWTEKYSNYLDPKLEIILVTDASKYGVRALFLHKYDGGSKKAITHAWRSLLPAENNHSQIIRFGVKKFHRFIHGRRICLQIHHSSPLTIYGSPPKKKSYYDAHSILTSEMGYYTITLRLQSGLFTQSVKMVCPDQYQSSVSHSKRR